MKNVKALMVLLLMICLSSNAFAQQVKAKVSDEKQLAKSQELIKAPKLTAVQEKDLEKFKASWADKGKGCTVALSVFGTFHHTAGLDVLLNYPSTITNEGGAWYGNSTFIAPCDGLYFFSISFEKDSYYHSGTTDDVNVYLIKNMTTAYGNAWSGEGDGRRGTGADCVILRLKARDVIQTWVHSDGGPMRHLIYYSFTAHRFAD